MPLNPGMQWPRNKSDENMAEDRKAITPIAEEHEGHNNAYRGTEAHGVPAKTDYAPPDFIETPDEVQDYPNYKAKPVPVYALNRRSRIHHHAGDYPLQAGETKIVIPRDWFRTMFRITDRDGSSKLRMIDGLENSSNQMGVTLPGPTNSPIVGNSQRAIVITNTDNAVHTVEFYYEYEQCISESEYEDDRNPTRPTS